MSYRLIFLIFVGVASCSCDRTAGALDDPLLVVPITLTGELILDAQPILTIGGDNRAPGHELHLVMDARMLASGGVALAQSSSQSVLVFDSTGTLLQEMGRAGEGPGEFKLIRSIHPRGADTIAVWDVSPQRITLFASGQTVMTSDVRTSADPHDLRESAMYQPYNLYALLPERFVLVHLDGSRDPRKHEREAMFASLVNVRGEYVAHIGRFEGTEWYQGVPLPLGPRSYAAATAGMFFMTDGISPDVIAYDTAGRAVHRIRLPIQRKALTDSDHRRVVDAFLEGVSRSARQSVAEIMADAPLPDSAPAITALRSSRDGRLWVRTYSLPGTTDRQWLVVDPIDRTATAVIIPMNYSVLDASGDRVLLLTSDSLGQEALFVHRLRQGAPKPPSANH